uniref:Uncharacterized protein n=1 Tax=Heterorhabditis bacteriophora TaxID=37862 RepID=A0A1I7WA51_HETBA
MLFLNIFKLMIVLCDFFIYTNFSRSRRSSFAKNITYRLHKTWHIQWGRVATGSDCSGEQSSAIFGSLAHNFFQSGDFANLQKERESALNFQSSTYQAYVHELFIIIFFNTINCYFNDAKLILNG